jgi:hypothetical protein
VRALFSKTSFPMKKYFEFICEIFSIIYYLNKNAFILKIMQKNVIALDFYSQLCNLAVNIWAKYDISPFLNAWA